MSKRSAPEDGVAHTSIKTQKKQETDVMRNDRAQWHDTAQTATTISQPPYQHKMRRVAVMFRRDLRLDDNPALMAAFRAGMEVIPLFIWAPGEEGVFSPGQSSRWWLEHSLKHLASKLERLGSRLIYFCANSTKEALVPFVEKYQIDALFFNHLYDPISLVRDNQTRAEMKMRNVHVETFGADLLFEPWEILDQNGATYCEFQKFWSAVKNMPSKPLYPLASPCAYPTVDPSIVGNRMSVADMNILGAEEREACEHLSMNWTPGSDNSWQAWQTFLSTRIMNFSREKAKVDSSCTSKLSPFIHYGEVSMRRIYYQLEDLELEWKAQNIDTKSIHDFKQQLGYREYSRYILFHNPFTHERPMLEHLRAVPWNYDHDIFKLWQQGCTGYPLVDAAMHELWSTGWCHNRLRFLVGHFLVKYLCLPWQWGLKYFWDTLIDADLECDTLGWQYLSGCMLDAQPFSYIIDYEEECRKFDPQGNYIRKWIPLISRLSTAYIHTPWKAPALKLKSAGIELGITYPHRIVNLDQVEKQVVHACKCIEENIAGPAVGPYRPPTKSDVTPNSQALTTEMNVGKEAYSPYKTPDAASDIEQSSTGKEARVNTIECGDES